MFNSALYKRGLKESWKALAVFASVLVIYFVMVIAMFDPALGDILNELTKAMPELMNMMGMNPTSSTLVGFLSAYMYGMLMQVFPMIFTIMTANKLIAKQVDSGSMTYLLAAPVKRRSVAFTQMKVLATGIFALIGFSTLVGIVVSAAWFPGALDIWAYVMMNAGALALHIFIGGVCYLASCIFSDAKQSIAFGAGIPTLSFIIQMLANAGDKFEAAKYASFFTLFNPDGIIAKEAGAIWGAVALLVLGAAFFAAAIIIFTRKDLHI